MILGMSIPTFTVVHTVISLVGIFTGLVVFVGMLSSKRLAGWTAAFLVTTVLTSVTGFLFPINKILPSHIFGVLSVVVLAVALVALYVYRLAGSWRWVYVSTALFALYLNVFVGIVQAFGKVPFLKAFAPAQTDPPFIVAQAVLLLLFIYFGYRAVRSFHPAAMGDDARGAAHAATTSTLTRAR